MDPLCLICGWKSWRHCLDVQTSKFCRKLYAPLVDRRVPNTVQNLERKCLRLFSPSPAAINGGTPTAWLSCLEGSDEAEPFSLTHHLHSTRIFSEANSWLASLPQLLVGFTTPTLDEGVVSQAAQLSLVDQRNLLVLYWYLIGPSGQNIVFHSLLEPGTIKC